MRPIVVIVVVAVVAAGAVGLGFELSSNAPSNATSVFSTTSPTTSALFDPASFCTASGPNLGFVTPLQSGSGVFIKVVTDQAGSIVNNGSVFVTHTPPPVNGTAIGPSNYCMHLMPNATGYMPLSTAVGSLPQGGRYSIKLIAGYDGGKSFQAVDPGLTPGDIVVSPNVITSFIVSIPSGRIVTVTCSAGSCQTTTTQTAGSTTNPQTSTTTSGTLTIWETVTRTTTVQNTSATTTTTSCSHTATVTVTTTVTSYSTTSGQIVATIRTTVNSTVTNYGSNTVTKSDCIDTTTTVTTATTVAR